MNTIYLGCPYIEKTEDRVRICLDVSCNIMDNNEEKTIWFEIDRSYEQYLYTDRVDAFLVGLLPYCLYNNIDIKVDENSGVSEDLLFQIKDILVPTLKFRENSNQINIEAKPVSQGLRRGQEIATGISRGVDSFYTLLKNQEGLASPNYVMLFNVQAYGENGGPIAERLFAEDVRQSQLFLKEYNETYDLNLKLITVDSNIQECFNIGLYYASSYRDLAPIILFRQFLKLYLFAEGWVIDDFSMKRSSRQYEQWIFSCLSIDGLRIQPFGLDVKRLEKISFISEYPITYKWLTVCRKPAYDASKGIKIEKKHINCTYGCVKCRRTVVEMMTVGKLDKYKEVFDTSWINAHKKDLLYEVLQRKNEDVWNELFDLLEKNGTITDEIKTEAEVNGDFSSQTAERFKEQADLMELFIKKKREDCDIKRFLKEAGYHSVAIYGMGRLGKLLYSELREILRCEIDKDISMKYGDTEIRTPEADFSDIDLIIITASYQIQGIKKYLESRVHCKIITLRELMDGNLDNNKIIGDIGNCTINWKGKNSTIRVGETFQGKDLVIDVYSDANITIGDNVLVNGECLWRFYDGADCLIGNSVCWNGGGSELIVRHQAKVRIGDKTVFNSNNLMIVHKNTSLSIGKDSLFARNVTIRTDDGHPMFDIETGVLLNGDVSKRNIEIGEHVWVGEQTMLLYSTVLGTGSIVGARSMLKSRFPNNCLIVGNVKDARVIRKNVAWNRTDNGEGISQIYEDYRKETEE